MKIFLDWPCGCDYKEVVTEYNLPQRNNSHGPEPLLNPRVQSLVFRGCVEWGLSFEMRRGEQTRTESSSQRVTTGELVVSYGRESPETMPCGNPRRANKSGILSGKGEGRMGGGYNRRPTSAGIASGHLKSLSAYRPAGCLQSIIACWSVFL